MTGTILQVNVSTGGVPKRPIIEGRLTALGVDGDSCAHPQIHGGPRQAVLLIAWEAIEQLRKDGYPVFAGALGENLTTAGLDPNRWRVGQRFRVGDALIEFTKVRGPCATLDVYNSDGRNIQKAIYDKQVRAGDTSSPRWGLSGIYAAVVRAGSVHANDIIVLEDQAV